MNEKHSNKEGSMSWNGMNRRQFPRIAYPCLVKVMAQGEEQSAYLTHTENIGVGGICIIVKNQLPMFSAVEVEIDLLEDIEHVLSRGRVVWAVRRKALESIKPMFYDVGIEFDNLSPKDKKRLEDAIEKFIKKGYKVLKPVY
jgi:c-di-GMP-binding flagellar brake protein YcgR